MSLRILSIKYLIIFHALRKQQLHYRKWHFAELKTGEKVVVKVQRPDIRKVITTDLNILEGLAKLMEKRIEESRIYNPVGIVNEFKETILKRN